MVDALTTAPPMSDRQREVLLLIAAGKTNGEIGKELFLATDTVKTHVRRLFRHWHVTSRVRLLEAARDAGLLPCGSCRRAAEDRTALADLVAEATRMLAAISAKLDALPAADTPLAARDHSDEAVTCG